jgi:MFS family permease
MAVFEGHVSETIGLKARLALVLTPWLTTLASIGLNPVLSDIRNHFDGVSGSASLVRLMVTIVGGSIVVGAPIGGFLAERFGERLVMLCSLAVFALVGFTSALIDNLHMLVIARAVLGLSIGAIGVTGMTIITTWIETDGRNRWLGYYNVSGGIGSFIILPLCGLIGSYNWKGIFLLHLIAVPMIFLIAAVIPRQLPQSRINQPSHDARAGLPWIWILLGIACGISAGTAVVYLPFHLAANGETRPQWVAATMVCFTLFMAFTSFFFGWIRSHFGVTALFITSFLLNAIGLTTTVVMNSWEGAMVGMSICGLGMGLMTPNLFGAAAASVLPERRARTLGFARAGFFSGPLVAQIPLDFVDRIYGPAGSLSALAVFSFVMITFTLLGRSIAGHRERAVE